MVARQFIDLRAAVCENSRKRLILRGQMRKCLRSVPTPRVLQTVIEWIVFTLRV